MDHIVIRVDFLVPVWPGQTEDSTSVGLDQDLKEYREYLGYCAFTEQDQSMDPLEPWGCPEHKED